MKHKIAFLISHYSDLIFLMPLMKKVGKNNIVVVYENRDKGRSLYGNQLKEIIAFDENFFKDCYLISLEKILKKRSHPFDS